MSIEFKAAIPEEFAVSNPVSTSKAVLRKNLVEFLPIEQTEFSYGQNQNIRFMISSNQSFLRGSDTYCRFDVHRSENLNGTPLTDNDNNLSLDVGGGHCLFKSIEVRTVNGVLLQRYDNYNKWWAVQSMVMDTPEQVRSRIQNADSMTTEDYVVDSYHSVLKSNLFLQLAISGAGKISCAGANIGHFFKVGDLVSYNGVGIGGTLVAAHGRVTSLTLAEVTLDVSTTLAGALAVGEVDQFTINGVSYINRRRDIIKTVGVGNKKQVILDLKAMSIFQHDLPLFVMKGGIEIIMELDHPNKVCQYNLHSFDESALNTDLSNLTPCELTITNPRMMCMMVTPHPDILNEFVNQWRSPEGLRYFIPSVRTRQKNGSVNNESLQINVGVRSVRRSYIVQQANELHNVSSTLALLNSNSDFIRGNINEFQVRVGAREYPQRRVQDLNGDPLWVEMYEHLQEVSNNRNMRLTPHEFGAYQHFTLTNDTAAGTITNAPDSTKFIMAVDFSRAKGLNAQLTGVDLSIVPLDLMMTRSATFASLGYTGLPIFYVFCEYDAYLKLQIDQTAILN